MGASNRGSGIKEGSIVLNRQLCSWELAKCCCLLSLLSGNKAICQTIVGGKLFLIHPLASERPSRCTRKTSRHSRKMSVCLKQRLGSAYTPLRDVIPAVETWTQPTHEKAISAEKRESKHGGAQFTFYGMASRICVFYQIIVDSPPPLCRFLFTGAPEPVPPECRQLEGMCSAFRHANIHNGMKILQSGVSLLNPAWYGAGKGCRLWTAVPYEVGGNSLHVEPNNKINPNVGAGSIRSTVNI